MNQTERYELCLHSANRSVRLGDLGAAIAALDKAETLTSDRDELNHLKMWRDRLERELEAKESK